MGQLRLPSPIARIGAVSALLFLPFFIPNTSALPATGPTDWIVDSDTVLHEETRVVAGRVLVTGNATLTLEGATLQVGTALLVEKNATLQMRPSRSLASRLAPADPDMGFWIHVNGTLTAEGTPRSIIEGLNGDPLTNLFYGNGGLTVFGHLDLRDTIVQNGTSGIIVGNSATAQLHHVRLLNLNFTGLGTWGHATLNDVFTSGSYLGVSGKEACNLDIRDSVLEATGEALLVNGCVARVKNTTMHGLASGVNANGAANVTIEDATIEGYRNYGFQAKLLPGPRPEDPVKRPRFLLEDVRFIAAELGPPAPQTPDYRLSRGINVIGSEQATIRRVTIQDHQGAGVDVQSASIRLEESVIQRNGGYGVRAVDATFENDLVEGNDFGRPAQGTANAKGPISWIVGFQAVAHDGERNESPGLRVEVYPAGAGGPVFESTQEQAQAGATRVAFEAYGTDDAGRPVFLGPFRYRATHPSFPAPKEGAVDVTAGELAFVIDDSAGPVWLGLLPLGMISAAVLLFLYAVVGGRLNQGLRRLRRRTRKRRPQQP